MKKLVILAITILLTYGALHVIINIVDGIIFQNGYIIFISAILLAAVHPLLNYLKIKNIILHTIIIPVSFSALFLLPNIQFSGARQLFLATVYYWILSYIVTLVGAALYTGYLFIRKDR